MTIGTEAGLERAERKPTISYAIATAFGVGYLKPGPGTWGSLAGTIIYFVLAAHLIPTGIRGSESILGRTLLWPATVAAIIAAAGVWSSGRVAGFSGKKDPQFVVVDEVSGQMLTYVLAVAPVNWKYLLLGLILFRVFDIWKPFPVRRAETLPGGWGIMADDWVASLYAAGGLWIARALGM